ncbi:helicase-associated domain-containing protein [Streptomyces apocyni]|uniref:helicase-associated domain-containing protein n=1 Tax=Streptomyces apocyni TaxID=2654677 RepID=UPI0012E9CF6A|nr:helicase C-terminal domain-containing protein [Streptomyces apocyni]
MRTESTSGDALPRTLAEALRHRDDASLAALLRARADLLNPVPGDVTQLATRAGTRASVVRALEHLDTFALQTAQALAVAQDPTTYDALRGLLTGDTTDPEIEAALPAALATLRERALVWGPDDRLRLVRTARELLTPSPSHPSPTGLGPTVAEATAGMSPGRLQQLLQAAGLPTTHDPVSAVESLTALFTDRARLAALLDEAPDDALDVLGRLTWGPPYGQVPAEPAAHVRWLLDRGLLLPTAPGTVVLPREAALHLRGGRAHRAPLPVPPAVEVRAEYRPQVVDSTAAGQAYTALSTMEELLREWHEGGPAVLRAGGLSVRDLKRTATALDVTEPLAAFWVELAYAAGLVASDGEVDERYAPTPAYDDWLELPPAERWASLAAAWLAATRTAGLVGGRDTAASGGAGGGSTGAGGTGGGATGGTGGGSTGGGGGLATGRTLSALGPHLDRSAAPEVRRRVLALLAGLPSGAAPTPDSVLARLAWERPLRGGTGVTPRTPPAESPTGPRAAATTTRPEPPYPDAHSTEDLRTRIARWTLTEAELLGLTGRGALSAHARALLGDPPPAADRPFSPAEARAAAAHAATVLAPLLPEPLDHVLLQADLTAVAPGPLRRPLAETLSVLADVESKGGATVYRFTPASVRRALDAGKAAADLHAFLAEHSRTPVPQPLSYLIDDVARRHGHLRIGAASAYVRCDDDAMLNEIMADKRAENLHLRRLAPTVLAAQADPGTLLDGLRAMGFAPAAESAEGDVLIHRAHAHRTPPRTAPAPVPEGPPVPDDTLLGAAVRAIRAGDLAAMAPRKPAAPATAAATSPATTTAGGALPRTTSAETLATMQAAVLTGEALWIGYVNAEGTASQRVIAPVRVEGGFVTAYDHTADEVRTYPLHRITGVAELADDAS